MSVLFTVTTPVGHVARLESGAYYGHVRARKPPALVPSIQDVKVSLVQPDEVRASKIAADAYWYARPDGTFKGDRPCFTLTCLQLDAPLSGYVATTFRTPQNGSSKGAKVWP